MNKVIVERFALKGGLPLKEVSAWQKAGTGGVSLQDKRARELPGMEGKYLLMQIDNFLGDVDVFQQYLTEDGLVIPEDSTYYNLFSFPLSRDVTIVNKEQFDAAVEEKLKKVEKNKEEAKALLEAYKAKNAFAKERVAKLLQEIGITADDLKLLLTPER